MTIKQTIVAVHALGLTCSWSAEWKEFRIDYKRDDPRYLGAPTFGSDYHADNREDAIGTARAMAAFQR